MMLIGRVAKEEGPWWSAHCDVAGVFTQGKSKADAMKQLADAFEDVVDVKGFKVTVTDRGNGEVLIAANDPNPLLAIVLRYQREVQKLSLADVQAKTGASSRNAYARYEQGAATPKLDTVLELLAAVAPDLTFAIVERMPARVAPRDEVRKLNARIAEESRSIGGSFTGVMEEYRKAGAAAVAAEPRPSYNPNSASSKGKAKGKAAQ